MKICAFDLETAKVTDPDVDDLMSERPLGISCAATLSINEVMSLNDATGTRSTDRSELLTVWHGGLVPSTPDDRFRIEMSAEDCRTLARHLIMQQGLGYQVVTWNGTGFDFDILAEECRDATVARTLKATVRAHVDVGLQFFCDKGFMVGLNAVAQGSGLGGKIQGMTGAKAPVMWADTREHQEFVLRYVAQDVRITAAIYRHLVENRSLQWITAKGGTSEWRPSRMERTPEGAIRALTVTEALELPLPDTSWMTGDKPPWSRDKFTAWLND